MSVGVPDGLDPNRVAAAKMWLTAGPGDQPYLSAAAYSLTTVPCDAVASMSVDTRWRLYVNPEWLAATEIPVVAVRLAQLLWHLLSDHSGRAWDLAHGALDIESWRLATEVTIGELLSAAGISHELPTPHGLHLDPGRSAEEHYARLSRLSLDPAPSRGSGEGEQGPDATAGSGCDGVPRGHDLADSPEDVGLDQYGADNVRRRVAIEFRSYEQTRPGTIPGEWARWVREILDPVVAWQQVLASSVRRAVGWTNGNTDYTYSRRSRRQASVPDVMLPGLRRPLPAVAVVVDTSASVDDGLLAQALGEVDGVLRGLGASGTSLTVLSVDAAAHTVSRVMRARDIGLSGGGGTDMRVGIDAAIALRPRCDVIVVLTDGLTPWPEVPPPSTTVVAALLGRSRTELPPTPAWMARVECVTDWRRGVAVR